MSPLPAGPSPATRLLLVRHGQTDWARDRRHTGRTDVPLNAVGRRQAERLAGTLPLEGVVAVWSSPLQRARHTAELAGLHVDRLVDDLRERDYGSVEGIATEDIRRERPGWTVWDDAPDDAEPLDALAERVDRVIAEAAALEGTVALVAHAHTHRVLAARWIGLPPVAGRSFVLDPAGWALLGWERDTRVVERWNPPGMVPAGAGAADAVDPQAGGADAGADAR